MPENCLEIIKMLSMRFFCAFTKNNSPYISSSPLSSRFMYSLIRAKPHVHSWTLPLLFDAAGKPAFIIAKGGFLLKTEAFHSHGITGGGICHFQKNNGDAGYITIIL